MYMETPVAVAEPDEGDMITVHASIQAIDKCQAALSRIMGLPYNHIRVGESFATYEQVRAVMPFCRIPSFPAEAPVRFEGWAGQMR